MELVLNSFRSQVMGLPNGHTMMKFQPLAVDGKGQVVLGDDGDPIPTGIPVVLVWTPQGLEAFKENLLGARGRIVVPGPTMPPMNGG